MLIFNLIPFFNLSKFLFIFSLQYIIFPRVYFTVWILPFLRIFTESPGSPDHGITQITRMARVGRDLSFFFYPPLLFLSFSRESLFVHGIWNLLHDQLTSIIMWISYTAYLNGTPTFCLPQTDLAKVEDNRHLGKSKYCLLEYWKEEKIMYLFQLMEES